MPSLPCAPVRRLASRLTRLASPARQAAAAARARVAVRTAGRAGWSPDDLDPEAFVRRAYRQLLGREADPEGLATHVAALRHGTSRADVLLGLVASPEFTTRVARELAPARALPDLRRERPDRYRVSDEGLGRTTFVARDEDDLAWLEARIHATGYYGAGGVWDAEVTEEKRRMARVVASLGGPRVLELGAYTGALVAAMVDEGLDPTGVELAVDAVLRAPADVRERLVVGDAVDPPVEGPFDAAVGLDIFEHVTPARLAQGLERLAGLVRAGGVVVANIPAFGADDVFGEVFPRYLASWEADAEAGRWFAELDCDPLGYPKNGHLVWADTRWWEAAFARAGFRRDRAAEQRVQAEHGAWFAAHAPARRSLYVFTRT